ncbi:DNA polymerase epsilon catalytic subunit [Dimargaris xerosporica]|nr:DNA polymerase epsilon catalytic subunit [Dimargaris xerosporica]
MSEPVDVDKQNALDARLGFPRYQEGPPKLGWLVNMHPTSVTGSDKETTRAAVDYYFLEEDGGSFKCTLLYEPYFYVVCKPGTEHDVEEYLRRKFERQLLNVHKRQLQDLRQPNHLADPARTYLQLSFANVQNLLAVRRFLDPFVKRNKEKAQVVDAYTDMLSHGTGQGRGPMAGPMDPTDCLVDLREYDVPYYVRVAIDQNVRVGLWYNVKALPGGQIQLEHRPDLVKRAEPVVLAFDIETTKLPLKFPDAAIDSIMMISYMIDGQGFLITNRGIVSQDIEDFEYTPKPEYEGPFTIFNEKNERMLLRRFFEHIQEAKPTVVATYNGDMFDWPFLEARAQAHGLDVYEEIGFYKDNQNEYKCKSTIHMDCFRWVKRDSYLPAGSHGLKAVTTAKLGYNPMELDPEEMTPFAAEQPQTLAQYSVSDAVATYYLYMKYIHPFIFSLCNIIPLTADEVLRKGSGTLCELLLMVQAYEGQIIFPNKHIDPYNKMYEGHLIETETYVGGHVEALEAGVFRSDIPENFKIVPGAIQQLIDQVDAALKFSIEVEAGQKLGDVTDYDHVKTQIVQQLQNLKATPVRRDTPLIYHLDVAAMYPNIILTNRLQPDAIIDESVCARCDFNVPGKTCDRRMTWAWRGEYYPAKRNELNMIKAQLESEKFPGRNPHDGPRAYHDLPAAEQAQLLQKRLTDYCRKVYKRIRENKVVPRESIICQRENPFYVDTVRSFRDRRYEYKGLLKVWKKKMDDAFTAGDATAVEESKKMVVLYDSLQLAHKCILNSFYGYVMRKGSRWYSMEMAGIVCLTGATLIQMARQLVEQIGRPLELDTDGIWCILPSMFPENFSFTLKNGKKLFISYPCVMLNHLVHAKFTNHQYQELVDAKTLEYQTRSENSIFFEVDGPYRAMILPSSTAADKLLKKRYAVFNADGSLAELKGFEVKRRGELKLIKIFQSQIFRLFLDGSNLEECYAAVARLADQWLDVLYSKGASLHDHELVELISENRSMSKSLAEYGTQKSTSISTARRLAEFLGDQVVKDKGLACKFIISSRPLGLPVSERAIPVTIFSAEPSVKKHYLRKWLRDPSLQDFDIRTILDWQYYMERFGSVIQKLITIPAAMQMVSNPVPRVRHPDWLAKRVAMRNDRHRQMRLTDVFQRHAGSAELSSGALQLTAAADDDADSDDESTSVQAGTNGEVLAQRDTIDLEDLATTMQLASTSRTARATTTTAKVGRVVNRKRTRSIAERDHWPALDLSGLPDPETVPTHEEDYGGWLQYQKLKWERQRQRRAAMRAAARLKAASGPGNTTCAARVLQDALPKRVGHSHRGQTLSTFFSPKHQALTEAPWQLLQVCETDTPGRLKTWIVVNQSLHTVTIDVPRVFYVNSQVPNPAATDSEYVTEVKHMTLPRSQPCFHLYRFTMPETVYQQHQKSFCTLFSHPDIVGVYETQVPSVYRFLLQIGCTTMPTTTSFMDRSGSTGNKPDSEFRLDDLMARTDGTRMPDSAYLDPSRVQLNFTYLFYSHTDTRHIMALITPSSGTAQVFISDGAHGQVQLPNLAAYYAERLKASEAPISVDSLREANQQGSEGYAFAYPEQLTFDHQMYKGCPHLFKAANLALRQTITDSKRPMVVVLHTGQHARQLATTLPALRDSPHVAMPFHKSDCTLPALDWQRYATRRMVGHFLNVGQWVHERIALARYSDTPLGNIEPETTLFLSDIFFARKLVSQNVVLWWSSASKPDLGGREEDEHQWLHEAPGGWETNCPGMYPTVCVELEVGNLAVNTVLQAPFIHELEGVSGMVAGTGFATGEAPTGKGTFHAATGTSSAEIKPSRAGATNAVPSNESVGGLASAHSRVSLMTQSDQRISQHVFTLLRHLVRGWYSQLAQHQYKETRAAPSTPAVAEGVVPVALQSLESGQPASKAPTVTSSHHYAEIMTQHVYRWLSHPSSKLYDPCLYGLVQGLMRKVFLQLLAELRRLGVTVVYANFQKIIVATTKATRTSAAAYTQYLLRTVSRQPLFDQIDLNPVEVWDRLLWMDPVNFGGVLSLPPSGSAEETPPASQPGSQNIEMSWNIREYLPFAIQGDFDRFIAEFIYQLHYAKSAKAIGAESVSPKDSSSAIDTTPLDDDGPAARPREDPTQAKALISQHFTRKLLRLLPEVEQRCTPDATKGQGDHPPTGSTLATQSPYLPGSHLALANPALEFTKYVCAVLSLVDGATREVRVLKRNALNLLGIREFSDDAEFHNPSQSLKLTQVVCEYCNYCRDLDFCRDTDLLPVAIPAGSAPSSAPTMTVGVIQYQSKPWLCPGCRHEYDRLSIELALVQLLLRRLQAYQLQDLKCTKCHMVKAENLPGHCPTCSAPYALVTSDQVDFMNQVRIFKNLAKFHQLTLLTETVDWIWQAQSL